MDLIIFTFYDHYCLYIDKGPKMNIMFNVNAILELVLSAFS